MRFQDMLYREIAVSVVVAVYIPIGCTTEPPTPTLKYTVVVAPIGVFEVVDLAICVATVLNPSQHARTVSPDPVLHTDPLSLNRETVSAPEGEYPRCELEALVVNV